jgi:hypothetical protein
VRAPEPTVRLRCSCGREYVASARQGRRVNRGEVAARCHFCKSEDLRKPLEELKTPQLRAARLPVTDSDRLWWLKRMSLDELIEITQGLYPEGIPEDCLRRWRRLERELHADELVEVA